MRFLADENVPRAAVEALRAAGHDCAWVRTDAPGAADEQVLERARIGERVILTFDADFGELVFARGLAASRGVVLVRLPMTRPAELARRLVAVLGTRDDWAGHFCVVEAQRVRMRPLRP